MKALGGSSIIFKNVKGSWDQKFENHCSRCSLNVWWGPESMKQYKGNKEGCDYICWDMWLGVHFCGLPQILGCYHSCQHTEKWMRIKSYSVSESNEVFHWHINCNSVLNGSRINYSLKIRNEKGLTE